MLRYAVAALLVLAMESGAWAGPPELTPWNVSATYAGDAQYDPRLERPLHFWGQGIPVAQVFAEVQAQTGVPVSCSPAGDDNERVCLNLYLNPSDPPPLRDFLAQLDWVLDSRFAITGRGEETRYFLLGTNMGVGVMEKLERASNEESLARQRQQEEAEREARGTALAKLEEIREALPLSREEVVKRYGDNDPIMVLALLDPARRAEAGFLLSVRDQHPEGLEQELPWAELTMEQRGYLKEMLRDELPKYAAMRRKPNERKEQEDDWAWFTQQNLSLSVSFNNTVGYAVDLMVVEEQPDGGMSGTSPSFPGLPQIRDPRLELTMALPLEEMARRTVAGEVLTDEQMEALVEESDARRRREAQRQALLNQLNTFCHLSAEAKQELDALALPADTDQPYALWQLQEAVAAASGRSVISDNFWQPARPAQPVLSLLYPGRTVAPTALSFLEAGCLATVERDRFRVSAPEGAAGLVGMEWGDAGKTLRFRSKDRDVLRAAFLPKAVLQALDSWLAPHLPAPGEEAARVTVPVELRHVHWVLALTDYLQYRWGGELTYGDPTDEQQGWRQALYSAFFRVTPEHLYLYRVLSLLSREQWAQLGGKGLTWQKQAKLEPTPEEGRFLIDHIQEGDLLRFVTPNDEQQQRLRVQHGETSWRGVEISNAQHPWRQQAWLVGGLTLERTAPAHLVAREQGAPEAAPNTPTP